MICVSLAETNLETCLKRMKGLPLAEIRLDLCNFDDDAIRQVFGTETKTVATFRPGAIPEPERLKKLLLAADCGATYIDVETESNPEFIGAVVARSKAKGTQVIVSYHNYESTPGMTALAAIAEKCFEQGADVAKLAVMAHNQADVAAILSLYSTGRRLVAFGMGEAGRLSRALAPLLGAEFTFAAPDGGEITAPGQVAYSVLKEQIDYLRKI